MVFYHGSDMLIHIFNLLHLRLDNYYCINLGGKVNYDVCGSLAKRCSDVQAPEVPTHATLQKS